MQGSSQGDFSLPGPNMHSSTSAQRKPSGPSQRRSSVRLSRPDRSGHDTARQFDHSVGQQNGAQENSQHHAATTAPMHLVQEKWWHVHLFRGMINDVKRRAPYYWSDWTDAWDYRVVPATVYMYFAKYARSGWISINIFSSMPCSMLTINVVSCLRSPSR
jgi:hypothetical protein